MNEILNPMRIIYPTDEEYAIVCRVDKITDKESILVFIRPAKETELDKLSNSESIKIHHDEGDILIDEHDCYAFGNVDLNNREDIDLINSFKWTTNRYAGFAIPRNYDYETNSGDTYRSLVDNLYKPATVETFDNVKLFKFAYAKIGKPKNVIIYGIRSKLRKQTDYA